MARTKRLERLYLRHRSEAVRLAFLLTRDDQMAEDLSQEAFFRVFSRFADLRKAESFAAYLRRTIVNLAHDHYRRRTRERNALETLRSRGARPPDADPDSAFDILSIAATLPRRQFQALVLRYCEDLSEAETADVLRTSVSAVKSLTNRGLRTLRDKLEGRDG